MYYHTHTHKIRPINKLETLSIGFSIRFSKVQESTPKLGIDTNKVQQKVKKFNKQT